MRWSIPLFFLGPAVLLWSPACAETIYDNGPPLLDEAYSYSSLSFGQQLADDFVLPKAGGVIRDIHWYGAYGGVVADSDGFEIRIYPNDGDRPDLDNWDTLAIAAGPVRQLQAEASRVGPLYKYSAAVEPYPVAGDTVYWLSIVENTSDAAWLWAASNGANAKYAWRPIEAGEDWRLVSRVDLAFSLTDDGTIIAEPTTNCILLLAGGMIVLLRRGSFR